MDQKKLDQKRQILENGEGFKDGARRFKAKDLKKKKSLKIVKASRIGARRFKARIRKKMLNGVTAEDYILKAMDVVTGAVEAHTGIAANLGKTRARLQFCGRPRSSACCLPGPGCLARGPAA